MFKTRIFLLAILFSLVAPATAKGPAVPDYPIDKMADNVYVIHGPLEIPNPRNQGFMNNPGFVITSAGVVMVDPGSSLQSGEMALRMLKTVTDKPVVAVFNTHVHGDHWLGNQAVRAAWPEVPIYGHPRMLEMIEAGEGLAWVDMMSSLTEGKTEGTEVVPPNHALSHGDTVKVGDVTFRMHDYGQAHTVTDLMIEAVEPSVIFLGDNVLIDRIPRISDGNIQGNILACDKAVETGAKTYVPGHGPTGDASVPKTFRTYLDTLYNTVKALYEEGLSDFEMKEQVAEALKEYADWPGFDDLLGKHISVAYLQVEEADF